MMHAGMTGYPDMTSVPATTRCWSNAGPASQIVAQHYVNIMHFYVNILLVVSATTLAVNI